MGFNTQNSEDKRYFTYASIIVGEFFTGIYNQKELKKLKDKMMKYLTDVTIRKNNERNNDLGSTTTIGNIKIKSIGTEGAKTKDDYKKVIHTLVHELIHAHITTIQREQKNKIIYNNIDSTAGYFISKKHNSNGQYNKYGLYFMEAMTEILTEISLALYEENYKNDYNESIDTLLSNTKSNLKSSYSDYLPLAKLMICAFSNWYNPKYDEAAKQFKGCICDLKLKTYTNNIVLANDLLYSFKNNPFYALEEYDSIMGKGSFINLLINFDKIKTTNINYQTVDDIIKKITVFGLNRIENMTKEGKISPKEREKLLENLNNQIQKTKQYYGIKNNKKKR